MSVAMWWPGHDDGGDVPGAYGWLVAGSGGYAGIGGTVDAAWPGGGGGTENDPFHDDWAHWGDRESAGGDPSRA